MILGVSHIVLGSTRFEEDRRTLERFGWTTRFIERDLPTHPGKRPFMATDSPAQSLALLEPPRGPAAELIHYADSIESAATPLQFVFPNDGIDAATGPAPQLDAVWPAAFEQPAPRMAELAGFTAPLCVAADGADSGVIVHFVSDLAAARRFWSDGLGFRPVAAGRGWARLVFHSVMLQWRATMLLVQRRDACARSLLDGPGFRCLSLVCSDLEKDRAALRRIWDAPSTGPMAATVNGKQLDLEICAGPDGAMIELLQLSRRAA